MEEATSFPKAYIFSCVVQTISNVWRKRVSIVVSLSSRPDFGKYTVIYLLDLPVQTSELIITVFLIVLEMGIFL